MKKLALALVAATAALVGQASAADMPMKAARPMAAPAPIASWTGLWISGGFGYGMAQYQHTEYDFLPPNALISIGQDHGAKGWLGKVGIGADYQFAGPFGSWVVGIFADTDWSDIKGNYSVNTQNVSGALIASSDLRGRFNHDWSWSVGGRIGFVALPGLLTYFNGGYTQGHFKGTNFLDADNPAAPILTGINLNGQTRDGWFLGGGTEYAVSQLPGLFWKNEVRFSEFESRRDSFNCTVALGCGVGPVLSQDSRVYTQKATTELVYRFNWGGTGVVAKY
jgi:outer membrane immunogenic protein